ncbi:AlbA family DNA-binding domain-containing protein [Algoriphagus aquimarinus]|uniref:Putative DNA-binding domain-containing protein n=1 Tax=Algoriphagus aquimarinus TaxID=237018 RepID=A0A1I0WWK6_9BACT|nr:ATP-binding protein [Algoriphagus aquimarinus]SFA93085.1 Putative DNA-binding domain-containing protein [Algoriphagus aquimarinus]|tara:strand:- start:155456 stop:156100 length:645 start_codon:yes stop_codon:yes gene_type:complete
MTLQDVKVLAAKGEGLRIEFKKKATFPEKIVRELIAFANTSGGDLLIGVDDDGTVSGQRYIEEEIFVMEKAINELIFPRLEYQLYSLKLNEKKGVAVFKVPVSMERPHYLKEKDRKRAYIRVADRSVQASKEVWEILRRGKTPRDMVFTYGRKEELLMKALGESDKITLNEFSKLANLPRFLASKTLVRLVLANVLLIHPQESEDLFTLKDSGV